MRNSWQGGLTSIMTIAALTVSLCGCTSLPEYLRNGFKVGPNYCDPGASVAEHWIEADRFAVAENPEILAHWWTVFIDPVLHEPDPVLNCLIGTAYGQNLTVKEAGCRVLQARLQRAIAVGSIFPQAQDMTGSYDRLGTTLLEAGTNRPLGTLYSDLWRYDFNLNWELDFWGKFRRAIIAADDNLQASCAAYNGALVTMLGDIAQNYVQLRTDQEQIRLIRENVELQQTAVKFFRKREKSGSGSYGSNVRLDKDQAEGLLAQTKAQIPPLQIDLRQRNDALCVLLGMPTVDLCETLPLWKAVDQQKSAVLEKQRTERSEKLRILSDKLRQNIPLKPEDLPEVHEATAVYIPTVPEPHQACIGIPADLLRRRPDVQEAERTAAAQAEQIGIALSDLYPAFSLNGTMGYSAGTFSELFSSNAFHGSVGPSFQWNLLNYGRIVNNGRYQDAKFQELVLAYQNTVLEANREVEDGLVNFLRSTEQSKTLTDGVMALRDAVDGYAVVQERVGSIDTNRYVVIAQNLVQVENSWAGAYGQISQGLIAVYRAMGGGWEIGQTGPTPPEALTPVPPASGQRLPEELPAPLPDARDVPPEPSETPDMKDLNKLWHKKASKPSEE
jgi:outer membrane protein TolC